MEKAKHSLDMSVLCARAVESCGWLPLCVRTVECLSPLGLVFIFQVFAVCSGRFVRGEVNLVIQKSVAELSLLSLQFAVSALEHRVYEVRETAVRIILDMYRQHPALTLEHLPPDDSATRRNLLYKAIFEGFAKIDGSVLPTEAEVRVSRPSWTDDTAGCV